VSETFEREFEDRPVNPRAGRADGIGDIIARRYSRRDAFRLLGGAAAGTGLASLLSSCATTTTAQLPALTEPPRGVDTTHHVAGGLADRVLIRWGDPLFTGVSAFDPAAQSVADQEQRFGYNCDFLGLVPLPAAADGTERALLCVNHEYTIADLMFPGKAGREATAEECAIEQAAHGGSIVEIEKRNGAWQYVQGSRFNRRITARTPGIEVTGPAAGHPRLATSADPAGRHVVGTLNNCAGGITPWGTYLLAEENFNGYFMGAHDGPEAENHKRYGVPGGWYPWGLHEARFDVSKEPNEPNRFGWILEVDPLDPDSKPKKRTALGRFKHEGSESIVAPDGRVVVYMGDDQRFDYVYKFVTAGRFNSTERAANMDLLDEGTLYVARFEADGSVFWMPMLQGEGPLTPENGFASQADVLIETRRAADLLGATPMDRPEDVEPDPRTGKVYVMLTNNTARKADQTDPTNPRGPNPFGHVIEITEPQGDFASTRSRWDLLVRCGDPADSAAGAVWGPDTSESGWFGSPDNCAIDSAGGLFVSTDGDERLNKCANGIWRVETEGLERGRSTMIFRSPTGAEVCGPRLSTDERTFFLAVQHPGQDGEDYPGHGRPSTFEDPSTRWPDFEDGMPPRPSVMALWRRDGRRFSDT
jgi:secreted PhoX family phosphatase|tara:strand:+ start:9453 stop:11390 length:1938 start_codon:yes stop_codon:yes gene_type:complete